MYLWDRTTAPVPRTESAAGIARRAGREVVTGDITREDLWVRRAGKGCDLLHPGQVEGSHFTGARLCVTLEPCRAAVDMVVTAHGLRWTEKRPKSTGARLAAPSAGTRVPAAPGYLGEGTAAPGPSDEVAASVSIRAAHLHVTLHLYHCGQKTRHQRHRNPGLQMERLVTSTHSEPQAAPVGRGWMHLPGPSTQPSTPTPTPVSGPEPSPPLLGGGNGSPVCPCTWISMQPGQEVRGVVLG